MIPWLLSTALAQSPAASCEAQCTAQVKEAGTQKAVSGVDFRIGEQLVQSDDNGQFLFDSQGQETMPLVVLSPEWRVIEEELAINPQGAALVWIAPINASALGLYRSKTEVTTHRVSRDEVASLPGSLQDPLRALQDLPGNGRSPMNAGWLLVRGSEPEDSQIDWQGLPLSQLFHLGGIASIFHPQSIGQILYRPSGWVTRKSSIGGSVTLESEERSTEQRLHIGTDIINSSLYATSPINTDLSIALSGRRSWLRQAISLAQGSDAAQIAPQFSDWSLSLQGDDASLMLVGLSDGIDAPTADGEEILQVGLSGHLLMGYRSWRTGKKKLLISGLLSQDARSLSRQDDTLSLLSNTTSHFHTEFSQKIESMEVQLGTDLSAGQSGVSYYPQTVERSWTSAEAFGSLAFGKKRRLFLGVRNTHLSMENHTHRIGLNPAMRIIQPLWRDLAFHLHVARRHQAPEMEQLIADPEGAYLPLERADELGSGLFWLSDTLHLSTEFFAKSFNDLAIRETDGTMGQFTGIAYGVESFFSWNPEPFLFRIGGGFSRSLRQEESHLEPTPHVLDPGIQFSALTRWKNDRGWTIAGRFRYASGVPFQNDRPTAFDLLTQEEILLKPTVNPTTGRLPDPHAIDLKVAKGHTFKRWRLEFYVDLQNLYNRRVPEPILTGFEELPVFGFGLPFLPVFGVDGIFWPQGAS